MSLGRLLGGPDGRDCRGRQVSGPPKHGQQRDVNMQRHTGQCTVILW
jgi:hypothetical protein